MDWLQVVPVVSKTLELWEGQISHLSSRGVLPHEGVLHQILGPHRCTPFLCKQEQAWVMLRRAFLSVCRVTPQHSLRDPSKIRPLCPEPWYTLGVASLNFEYFSFLAEGTPGGTQG